MLYPIETRDQKDFVLLLLLFTFCFLASFFLSQFLHLLPFGDDPGVTHHFDVHETSSTAWRHVMLLVTSRRAGKERKGEKVSVVSRRCSRRVDKFTVCRLISSDVFSSLLFFLPLFLFLVDWMPTVFTYSTEDKYKLKEITLGIVFDYRLDLVFHSLVGANDNTTRRLGRCVNWDGVWSSWRLTQPK